MNRKPRQDRAMISVAALIALMIVAIVCAAMLKVALARRVEVNASERRVQSAWLLEAGIDRASARLGVASDYRGETWNIPREELGGRGAGLVVIQVGPIPDHPNGRRVEVSAEYPAGSPLRAVHSQVLTMDVPNPPR